MDRRKVLGHRWREELATRAIPMLPEVTEHHPARAPSGNGQSVACPWGLCEFDPKVAAKGTQATGSGGAPNPGTKGKNDETDTVAPHATSILIKLLHAARIARFDLLQANNFLARNATK